MKAGPSALQIMSQLGPEDLLVAHPLPGLAVPDLATSGPAWGVGFPDPTPPSALAALTYKDAEESARLRAQFTSDGPAGHILRDLGVQRRLCEKPAYSHKVGGVEGVWRGRRCGDCRGCGWRG